MSEMKHYTHNYQKSGGRSSFSDYYTACYDHAILMQSLKDDIVFASHNLGGDGVFGEMQMVLCRNVLIYFKDRLKDRALDLFHSTLADGGFLCLGTKETLDGRAIATVLSGDCATYSHLQETSMPELPGFKAIVIGISTGGIEALKDLLGALPKDFLLPILIVHHISPDSGSGMANLLDGICNIRVKEADDQELPVGGTVYMAPANYHLLVETDGKLGLSTDPPVNYARPSVDVLFETAADAFGKGLIGVVLTGAGNDGSRGLKRIKETGGVTVVQDPDDAAAGSMPQNAIMAVTPDYIINLASLPQLFINLIKSE